MIVDVSFGSVEGEEISWPDHGPYEYKGFVVCRECDTIHCPANHESKCPGRKGKRNAKAYIDGLKKKANDCTKKKCPNCGTTLN